MTALRLDKLLKLSLFLVMAGCLTPIDFELENQGASVSISGQVSTIQHRNFVQIGTTNGARSRPAPVLDAHAVLVDQFGNRFPYRPSIDAGIYVLTNFTGIPGIAYHVEVFLSDGTSVTSVPEVLPRFAGRDSVYYDFTPESFVDKDGTVSQAPFINVRTKASLPVVNEPLYVKWTVDEIFMITPTDFPDPFGVIPPNCYVTQAADPQRVVLFNGDESRNRLDSELLIASRIVDNSFHTRHFLLTYLSSVSPEAFEYWRKVNILANQVGSIFDAPPATITGNVKTDSGQPVYGYFQATNEDYHKISITRFDIPYPFLPYCEYDPAKPINAYPFECLECIDAANSSYFEPALWAD